MRKFVLVLMFLVGGATYSMADTLTLEGVGAGNIGDNGGAYTFPYIFSINGSLSLTPLMCDDFADEIWIGESWNVTNNSFAAIMGAVGATYSGAGQMSAAGATAGITGNYNSVSNPNGLNATQMAYADAAYIFTHAGLVNGASATDIAANEAVWELFATTPTFSDQSTVDSILSAASAATAGMTVASAEAQLQNVIFYTPACTSGTDCGQIPTTDDTHRPQEFIGVVPEPANVVLLGSGLLGLAFVIRRKKLTQLSD